jgi:hypothetical protein
METIKKIILWLISPFDNHSTGGSMRKWMSFLAVGIAAKLSFIFTNSSTLSIIVSIWLIYSALCLALITGAQIIELKNGNKNNIPNNEEGTN